MHGTPRSTIHEASVGTRRGRVRHGAIAAVAVLGTLAVAPATGSATVSARTADMNGGGFVGFDQTNASVGTLRVTASRTYEGAGAAHATYGGGGSNGFARGIFNVGWADGDDVHYGSAFYLPVGFTSAIKSQTDVLRHDNFSDGTSTDYGGIGLVTSDRKAHLYRLGSYVNGQSSSGSGSDMNVSPAFALPEGRWFWLEVRQRLSATNGRAVNEVWIDDRLVSSSTKANSFGRGVTRLRYGLVAIGEGKQTTPLELWFDRATVRSSRIGAIGGGGSASAESESARAGTDASGGATTEGGHSGASKARAGKRARIRLRRARVRAGRLSFRVVASQPIAMTRYRKSSQKRYRRYRASIRLTRAQRRRSNVRLRVTFKDRSKATATLRVRKGRVSAR